MPTTTTVPVDAYAFCLDSRCPGYDQQPVRVERDEVTYTGLDLRADNAPAPDRSSVYLRWPEGAQRTCEHCDGHLELSLQLRPEYPKVTSPHDDEQSREMKLRAELRGVTQEAQVTEMRAELAELKAERAAELAELKAALAAATAQRSKPGPKPRTQTDE